MPRSPATAGRRGIFQILFGHESLAHLRVSTFCDHNLRSTLTTQAYKNIFTDLFRDFLMVTHVTPPCVNPNLFPHIAGQAGSLQMLNLVQHDRVGVR